MKTLGLLGFLVAALLALASAGTASATELTCTEPAGTKVMCPNGTVIHAVSEGPVVIHLSFVTVECNESTIEAKANTGSSSETVVAPITTYTLSGCNCPVTVLKAGTLEIHTTKTTPNNDGTVTHSGKEITIECLGFHCIYTGNGIDIGDLTGSSTTGATPTIDVNATTPRTGGRSGAFCGSTDIYTASYKITTPDWMDVD